MPQPSKKAAKKAASTNGTKTAMSISALAKRFELERETVRNRLEKAKIEPVSVRANQKLYYLEDVNDILNLDELEFERVRKTRADADLSEIKVKEKTGELVSVEEVSDYNQRLYSGVRKKIQTEFPRKIAKRLLNARSEFEITEILTTELDRIFTELRNDHRKFL